MKKAKPKKSAAKKVGTARPKAKSAAAKTNVGAAEADLGAKLSFNHAMIYARDVGKAILFYRDILGFKVIEDFRHENQSVYARLRAPGGDGTIALHQAAPGAPVTSDGVRLYFEIRELDEFCRKLQQKNFYITQMPRMMPWGWRHAYLNDPDGHEISLYWAGENRMKKTVMQAAAKAARA
jgi:catechol 2,3-dioxygenase-like lactoylglutathione lyase family enzyme